MEINSSFLDALGFTLVDSLWQGLIIMAVAFLGLAIMRKAPARWRHNFLLVCILALPLGGMYSFNQHYQFSDKVVVKDSIAQTITPNVSTPAIVSEGLSEVSQLQMEAVWLVDKAHWIGLVWLLGLVVVSFRGFGGMFYLKRLKSNATTIEQPEIIKLLTDLKADFGLKTTVLIKESSKVMSPLVSGYFKPIILFPLGLIQGLTTEEVEVILLHELAHLKRNDFIINIVINGLRAVYFYHPAYWWLQSQLDNEREYATDEMVMSKQSNGLLLVRALAKTQEYKMTTPSLGFAGNSKNQLLKRVNRIMKKQQNPNWLSGAFTMILLCSAFILMSQSQQTKQDSNPQFSKTLKIDSVRALQFSPIVLKTDSLSINGFSALKFGTDTQNLNRLDTNSIALAIQEIVQVPSPIMAEFNGDGVAVTIKRNGKALEGEEFKTYQKAFNQLNQYANKRFKNDAASIEKLAKLAGINFKKNASNLSRLAQMARVDILEDSMSAAAYNRIRERYQILDIQEQVRLLEVQQRMQSLKKQAEELKSHIKDIDNDFGEKTHQKYLEELLKLEEEMASLNFDKQNLREKNDAFLLELDLYKSKQQEGAKLTEYIGRLNELVEKKQMSIRSGNNHEQELLLRDLEQKMKALVPSIEIERMKSLQREAERLSDNYYVKKKLIGSLTEGRNPKDKGLYEHTRVTPDNETFTFAEQDGRTLWVQYAFDILYKKELKNTLFQVDGKTMKKWSFDDFKAMDFLKIIEIDFWANDDMKNHFKDTLSKRVLKNYDSVISIRTN